MGRIKPLMVKRATKELMSTDLPFNGEFDTNKKMLGNTMPSKKSVIKLRDTSHDYTKQKRKQRKPNCLNYLNQKRKQNNLFFIKFIYF